MKIYETEIKDGLVDQLNNNSVAYCSVATVVDTPVNLLDNPSSCLPADLETLGVSKASDEGQMDLFYLKSILVSTGWNKNDDVFDPIETFAARNTPEDKPFNYMHDEKDIIGHITGNSIVDFEGNAISEEGVPPEFNILTTAVIYKEWSDLDQRERIQKILAEIEEGKWFVSMECLFPNFDYALVDSEGKTRVVNRNEASAFLTKHLRSYGGSGQYEDYKVGRLLRNLSFSGKGLVSKPANPRSIILEGNRFFDESEAQILTISSIKENLMSDNHEKQIADLQAKLEEAKAANDELTQKVVAEKVAEYESSIQSLEATIAENTETIKTLSETNESLLASNKQLESEAKVMKDEMEEIRKNEAMMKRQAQLEEVGFGAEEAVATVEDFSHLDDETFDKLVATMKGKSGKMPPWMKKDDEKKEEKEKDAKAQEETEAQEELDPAEASEEVLEQAEKVEEVAIAEINEQEDPAESLRSVASEWLGSVLQTLPKQDK